MEIEWQETCVRCGANLPDGVRISREYCSRRCYMEGYRELETQAVMEARAKRPPCANCGKPIPMTRDMRAIYCSPECNRGAHAKTCPHCKKEFLGSADQVHCSWFCHSQATMRINQPRPCGWCGTPIMRPRRAITAYCSLSCAGKAGMHVRLRDAVLTVKTLDLMLEKIRPKRPYRMRLTPARLDRLLTGRSG